jgi:4-carboxymuconolactone decarboxylase
MKSQKDLRRQGEATREKLFGAAHAKPQAGDAAPGFRELVSETVFGAMWNRPGLAYTDRMICTLSALCAVQRLPQLRRYVGAALNLGMEPRSIMEPFIQIGIYAGFAATEEAIDAAAAVFAERGVELPAYDDSDHALDALYQRGEALLQTLHRERGELGYAAPDNPFTSALYPFATQYGYGEIWHRPGLDLRQRAMCSLAGFTALAMEDQLKKFAQSALNVGMSKTEVIEAIAHTGPYSGFARALNALRWLSQVL